MDINALAARQYDWVERMKWHNKTVLESLALIGSEIGEAAEEAIADSDKLGEELADIFLRIADLAHTEKFDLAQAVADSKGKFSWRTKNIREDFAELMVEWAKWVNTARKESLDESFSVAMGLVLARVFDIATGARINMEKEILRKMEINEERGTRGRRI